MAQVELTVGQLEDLLRDAEKAHADYEARAGQRDPDWAHWYARWIGRELGLISEEDVTRAG